MKWFIRQAVFRLVVSVMALAAAGTVNAEGTWRGLTLAPEHRCAPYDRDDYPYSQSVETRIIAGMGGRVYGPYTGRHFASRRETDIEHMVATSEAHDSGLCAADAETKHRFASDLLNLTLAAPAVNRHQKSGKDAGEWMPRMNRCWFAGRVEAVKRKYGLTVDAREARALVRSSVRVQLDRDGRGRRTGAGGRADTEGRSAKHRGCAETVGHERERENHVQGGPRARHRAGAPGASGLPVHAGRGWGRGGLRITRPREKQGRTGRIALRPQMRDQGLSKVVKGGRLHIMGGHRETEHGDPSPRADQTPNPA